MGGERHDSDELRISPEILEYLFRPLQDVLKDNGAASIEMTNQLKMIVTLVTSHPTRQHIADALNEHNKQALAIKDEVSRQASAMKEEVTKLRDAVIRLMWLMGLSLACYEFVKGYITK